MLGIMFFLFLTVLAAFYCTFQAYLLARISHYCKCIPGRIITRRKMIYKLKTEHVSGKA